MDDELRNIFLKVGKKEAPEGFAQRLMNRITAEAEKPGYQYNPIIGRKTWFIVLVGVVACLLVVVFFGQNISESGSIMTDFLYHFIKNVGVSQIHLPELPAWPIILSLVALVGYIGEDYLIRRFLRKKL